MADIELVALQEAHIAKLKDALDAGGDASLQNGLDLAVASLKTVPPYGHREVSLPAMTFLVVV